MKLVVNEKAFAKFVDNVLPDLADGEVYFVSLSARNKYLTEFERETLGLGRTEMFGRSVVRSKSAFRQLVRRMEAEMDGRTTKNGWAFPSHAMVVYVNVNPSNMLKATGDLQKTLAGMTSDWITGKANGKDPSLSGFLRLDRLALDSVQKATGVRHYVDVDLDSDNEQHYLMLRAN